MKSHVALVLQFYNKDNFTKQFTINRTDIIMEALKSYISEQKEHLLYEQELLNRVNEVKSGKIKPISRDEAFDGIEESQNFYKKLENRI